MRFVVMAGMAHTCDLTGVVDRKRDAYRAAQPAEIGKSTRFDDR
jgi:hypothetical protein